MNSWVAGRSHPAYGGRCRVFSSFRLLILLGIFVSFVYPFFRHTPSTSCQSNLPRWLFSSATSSTSRPACSCCPLWSSTDHEFCCSGACKYNASSFYYELFRVRCCLLGPLPPSSSLLPHLRGGRNASYSPVLSPFLIITSSSLLPRTHAVLNCGEICDSKTILTRRFLSRSLLL